MKKLNRLHNSKWTAKLMTKMLSESSYKSKEKHSDTLYVIYSKRLGGGTSRIIKIFKQENESVKETKDI
jgi:hypothetical protein